ncbi:MAG: hypothetical protein NVSMB27_45490 [Ktedonobacteraceae bacterium]
MNQLLAVTAFMLMLPPISYFYTLVHLYAPWLLLVFLALRAQRSRATIPGLTITLYLFLPLFVSFTLLTYAKVLVFGGLVQAVALYGLFACAVQYPFEEPARILKTPQSTRDDEHSVVVRCHVAEVNPG